MTLSFLTPSRSLLRIGDDRLSVYDVTPKETRLVGQVPWDSPDFSEIVVSLIKNDCGGKSAIIVNDMTDQHFKGGQRLPKVSVMDKANVLERKLTVAFPNYPIRGALSMKKMKSTKKKKGDKKSDSSDLYLFAAVPMSDPVSMTIEVVKRSLVPLSGFYLLPIESADMLAKLAVNLAGKVREPSRWTVFVGHHQDGSLRQIITRNGRLAMTRMTPMEGVRDEDDWAYEINQEFKATLSYLSRFGYSEQDSMDLIVVCNPKAGQALEAMITVPCYYTALTALEAAKELGLKLGNPEEPYYADLLHAAWIGQKASFVLPMKATDIEKVHRPRVIARFVIVTLFFASMYMGWNVFNHGQSMLTLKSEIDFEQKRLANLEREKQDETDRMNALGYNIKLIQSAIDVYEKQETKRIKFLSSVRRIGAALGQNLKLDSYDIVFEEAKEPDTTQRYGGYGAEESKNKIKITLKISFPKDTEITQGVNEVELFKRRLARLFPQYRVSVAKNVAGVDYYEEFSSVATDETTTAKPQDMEAILLIEGDVS